VTPEQLAAKARELVPQGNIGVAYTYNESGSSLIVAQGISEPALPLQARSATQFVSGITATGFEFVTDANGNATQVIIRTADSQVTAVRKESR
jgi:hypothetical protein